jgi:hypothetical protein
LINKLIYASQNTTTVEPFLFASHSLLAYTAAHKAVVKLRDQKQLDFEELSAYLSAVVSERDRLAALSSGHAGAPVGLGTYLRDQVDRLRGTDDIHTRRERMRKLDGRIKEVSGYSVAWIAGCLLTLCAAARSRDHCARDVYSLLGRGAEGARML